MQVRPLYVELGFSVEVPEASVVITGVIDRVDSDKGKSFTIIVPAHFVCYDDSDVVCVFRNEMMAAIKPLVCLPYRKSIRVFGFVGWGIPIDR